MPRQPDKISPPRSNRLIWVGLIASPMLVLLVYLLFMMASFGGSEMTGMGQ
jgi:acyl dehydratase